MSFHLIINYFPSQYIIICCIRVFPTMSYFNNQLHYEQLKKLKRLI